MHLTVWVSLPMNIRQVHWASLNSCRLFGGGVS